MKNMSNPPCLCAGNVLKVSQCIKQNKYLQNIWKFTVFHRQSFLWFLEPQRAMLNDEPKAS